MTAHRLFSEALAHDLLDWRLCGRLLRGKDERNDLSVLFVLKGEANRITRIRLHPTRIEDLGVPLANEQEWQFLKRTMQAKCKAFGTTMDVEGQVGTITVK
jgi:hypothetical protein